MNQLCRVCGEPAAGFHFGAFTCEGCKVRINYFFPTNCRQWDEIKKPGLTHISDRISQPILDFLKKNLPFNFKEIRESRFLNVRLLKYLC